MRNLSIYLFTFAAVLLMGCKQNEPKYIIGVSQCSEDIWRDWQNAEMRMEANFHEGVELRFTAAHDDSELQSKQIDSLVASGISLLIVAPNQLTSVSPAIDRAYDKGIPVIVFERKTDSRKYTAFVSADNYEMGHIMGEYIATQLNGKGTIMEIMGLKGSSPAEERYNGFHVAIASYPEIKVVTEIQGDWTEPTAYEAVKNWKGDLNGIDVVFGHNDRSAIGARKAFEERGARLPMFCGIDALPGVDGGIQQVRDSLLDASYIYPTRGDQLLQLAIDILDGKQYQKETMLTSALVTRDNATVLLLESDEVVRQAHNLNKLQKKAAGYLEQLSTQRTISLLALFAIALLALALVLFILYYRSKVSAQRERIVNNLWNMEAENVAKQPVRQQPTVEEPTQEPLFIIRFKDVVEARLSDSDLSVDDLAAAMNLSRVQLYRKVKAISGSSPVELLRTARLNRGYQLLVKGDKTISEVAYEVGFTAPSYFTKCFKEEFGISPSDLS
ncbi:MULTISPECIES: substrate-binding domain-containing protein [unclassified Prevotella]|uniref:AraC family transcriptional regulator n=1 Tax=unclassified Prevotella TaxID=2638335 RepID=UPI0018CC36C3|nr:MULTISPECIES: substrate-binding domain-containing protein [unclassified Prevotella]